MGGAAGRPASGRRQCLGCPPARRRFCRLRACPPAAPLTGLRVELLVPPTRPARRPVRRDQWGARDKAQHLVVSGPWTLSTQYVLVQRGRTGQTRTRCRPPSRPVPPWGSGRGGTRPPGRTGRPAQRTSWPTRWGSGSPGASLSSSPASPSTRRPSGVALPPPAPAGRRSPRPRERTARGADPCARIFRGRRPQARTGWDHPAASLVLDRVTAVPALVAEKLLLSARPTSLRPALAAAP